MKRDNSIDIAKGIGILLVVFGHIVSQKSIRNFIYMFHMPLFFIISGMTLFFSKQKNKSIKKFIIGKFKTIMFPYMFFSIISFIYWFLIERKIRNQINIEPLYVLKNIFLMKVDEIGYSYNVVLWFLPCLFVSTIIGYILLKLKSTLIRVISTVVLMFIGFTLNFYKVVLPFSLETSLLVIPFILSGYYIYSLNIIGINKKSIYFMILSIFFLIFIFAFNSGNNINMLNHQYGNFILFYLIALSICFLIIKFAKMINIKLLEFIGNNSLIIMCVHEPLKRIVIEILSKVFQMETIAFRMNLFCSIIALIVTIITIFPIIKIFNNFFPFLLGKSTIKEKSI